MIVDYARDFTSEFYLERHHVSSVTLGYDRLLQVFLAVRGCNDPTQRCHEAPACDLDLPTKTSKLRTGIVLHFGPLVNAAGYLRGNVWARIYLPAQIHEVWEFVTQMREDAANLSSPFQCALHIQEFLWLQGSAFQCLSNQRPDVVNATQGQISTQIEHKACFFRLRLQPFRHFQLENRPKG